VALAAGLGALGVRGAGVRVGVAQDVVAAVAVAAGRGRVGEAGHEQRLGMHAGEIALHHLFVADAAVAHLVEVRHRRGGIVAAHGRVDAAVAALAGLRLAALDLGVHAALERRDLVLVAVDADLERHRSELVARMLDGARRDVALDALDPLVRPALNASSWTASEFPASSFISASSWHPRHFELGIFGTSATGAASVPPLARPPRPRPNRAASVNRKAEKPRMGTMYRRSRARNMRELPCSHGAPREGSQAARRVSRLRYACEFDPRAGGGAARVYRNL